MIPCAIHCPSAGSVRSVVRNTIFRAFCPLPIARRLPRLTVRLQVPPQKVAVTEEVLVGHPEELDDFCRAYPEFIWGPLVFAALVRGAQELPPVAARIAAKDMTAYGFFSALHYTVFAIMLSYAFHAFVIMHVSSQGKKLKLQDGKPYNTVPKAMVARSTAAICTSLVYSVFPFAAPSTSWLHFWGAVAALAVFWDAWFYFAHRCECPVYGRALPFRAGPAPCSTQGRPALPRHVLESRLVLSDSMWSQQLGAYQQVGLPFLSQDAPPEQAPQLLRCAGTACILGVVIVTCVSLP